MGPGPLWKAKQARSFLSKILRPGFGVRCRQAGGFLGLSESAASGASPALFWTNELRSRAIRSWTTIPRFDVAVAGSPGPLLGMPGTSTRHQQRRRCLPRRRIGRTVGCAWCVAEATLEARGPARARSSQNGKQQARQATGGSIGGYIEARAACRLCRLASGRLVLSCLVY